MRACKKCGETRSESEFYASNKATCVECLKASARANREENLAYYRAYDRKRYREMPERKEAARKSSNSEAGMRARKKSREKTKMENPEKYKARNAVANALRDGKLTRGTACYFCNSTSKLQAHHQDYSRPLDVYWLCAPCHGKLHAINGDFHRPMEVA